MTTHQQFDISQLDTIDKSTFPPDGGPDFNRLIISSSPYLRQHATNPVDCVLSVMRSLQGFAKKTRQCSYLSARSVMASVLLRLADLTDDTELGAHGEALLRCRLGQAAAQPTAFA